jgi:hypothetical protein
MGNTHTDGQSLFLHGNLIAWHIDDETVAMTLCGWPTVTTRERLNGICTMLQRGSWYQMKHEQYFDEVRLEHDHEVKQLHFDRENRIPLIEALDGTWITEVALY